MRLEHRLLRRLERLAQANDRTLSAELRVAIRQHLDRQEEAA
jgi:predicted transcriptional regulator